MLLLFAAYALICLWQVRLNPQPGENWQTDYLSVDKTMAIKGIFILMVFFSHFNGYVSYTALLDTKYFYWFNKIGQWMVTMFLFYSGYGVMESIKRSGARYVRRMPVHRIGRTLLNFDLAVLLYGAYACLQGQQITGRQFLLSLVGWDSLGNSNWYIFIILVLYAFTWIAFLLCGDRLNYWLGAAVTGLMTAGLVFFFLKTGLRPPHWYDTALCYAFGVLWSLVGTRVARWINRWDSVYLVLLISTVLPAVWFGARRAADRLYDITSMLFFCAAMLLLTMRISFDNAVLRWCGKHLFSIYILQRIVMLALGAIGLNSSIYLYFILSLALTLPIAWGFDQITGLLWNRLTGKTP